MARCARPETLFTRLAIAHTHVTQIFRLQFHLINFAISFFPMPKQIVGTHSYIIFLCYTKKCDLIDEQVLFWRHKFEVCFA